MSTIITRSGKGFALTWNEVDANFTNLNTDKYQSGDAATFTTLTATGQTSLGGAAGSEGLRVTTTASANRWVQVSGGQSGVSSPSIGTAGGSTAIDLYTNGGGAFNFWTNGNGSARQAVVSHTASAVNYVQVTGAATSNIPLISAQGSDSGITLGLSSKGANTVSFYTNNGASRQAAVVHTGGTVVNYVTLTGGIAGAAPAFSVAGTDTNIDLALTPKGTGLVRFGTRTASADAPITGYIEIKDSGGTIRRLAVIG